MRNEARFRMVEQRDPKRFRQLLEAAQKATNDTLAIYDRLARRVAPAATPPAAAPKPAPVAEPVPAGTRTEG
jgi:hypothetical protein